MSTESCACGSGGTDFLGLRAKCRVTDLAVLIAVDDLESLEETIAVLSDPTALRALGEAEAEIPRGEGENQDSLTAAMRARRART